MARTELFDLFFHPVFQKCLKHAEASMSREGNDSAYVVSIRDDVLKMIAY